MLADKVPYYILDLLQQTPSVYVAGLGRFEAIFHPAIVDMPHSRIKPPYVEPDFRNEEEPPSETLEAYITYVSGPGAGSPNEAIETFVRNVLAQTTNGQSYPIEKFGTFSRNHLDNIRFTPDWDAFNLSFSSLEVLDIRQPMPEYIAPPPVYTPPVVEKSSTFEVKSPVSSVETVDIKTVADVKEVSLTQVKEEVARHQDSIDETTSRLWWVILISALVLIAVLCAYLAWDIVSNRRKLNDLKQIYPDTISATRNYDSLAATNPPTVAIGASPTDTQVLETNLTPPAKEIQETSGTPCYIVVGAFTDPTNRTRMMERLTTLGYVSEEIKGGSLTRVAIRTDCDQANLQKMLNEARSTINPEAWIY